MATGDQRSPSHMKKRASLRVCCRCKHAVLYAQKPIIHKAAAATAEIMIGSTHIPTPVTSPIPAQRQANSCLDASLHHARVNCKTECSNSSINTKVST